MSESNTNAGTKPTQINAQPTRSISESGWRRPRKQRKRGRGNEQVGNEDRATSPLHFRPKARSLASHVGVTGLRRGRAELDGKDEV